MSNEGIDVNMVLGPLEAKGQAYFQMRYAVQHLMAAAGFSRRVGELQRTNEGQVFGPFFDEILWNATACVFCSVASLEAYANEFFIDRKNNLPDLPKTASDVIWECAEENRILGKFDLALRLKECPSLGKGREPYQSVDALIELRNAMTHFKPEWEWEKKGVHSKVSSHLAGKFQPSPFCTGNGGLFPMRWASHSCTSWAVNTTLQFAKDFEIAAGLTPRFDQFKDRLKP